VLIFIASSMMTYFYWLIGMYGVFMTAGPTICFIYAEVYNTSADRRIYFNAYVFSAVLSSCYAVMAVFTYPEEINEICIAKK